MAVSGVRSSWEGDGQELRLPAVEVPELLDGPLLLLKEGMELAVLRSQGSPKLAYQGQLDHVDRGEPAEQGESNQPEGPPDRDSGLRDVRVDLHDQPRVPSRAR